MISWYLSVFQSYKTRSIISKHSPEMLLKTNKYTNKKKPEMDTIR